LIRRWVMDMQKADRLYMITQRIGYAIWQIQELERCTAHYLVLATQAKRGMGAKAGNELLLKAVGRTLGETLRQAKKAGILEEDLERRFVALLAERNWLVHSSRSQSRGAIHNEEFADILVRRIDAMAEESDRLLAAIGGLVERHVKSHGVSQDRGQISKVAARIQEGWHKQEPPSTGVSIDELSI